MEIPLQAKVECTDGVFGTSAYVLLNPVTDKVTHLVVKEEVSPNTEQGRAGEDVSVYSN